MSRSGSIDHNTDRVSWIACGIILTLFAVFGLFYSFAPRDLTWFHFLKEHPLVSILAVAATFAMVCLLLQLLFGLLDRVSSVERDVVSAGVIRVPLKRWAAVTGVILLLWLPYLIIVSPGTIAGLDYCWQLMQGCGALPLSNHHPIVGSIVFGVLYRIGAFIGGAKCGILATAVFQCVFMAAVIGYCLSTLSYLGLPKPVTAVLTIIYGIDPVIALHAIWAVKDSIFSSIAMLFFFGLFLRVYSVRNTISIPRLGSMPVLILLAVLFSLYRNGTTIVALIALASVIVYEIHGTDRSERKFVRAFAPLLVFCLLISGWSMMIKAADIYPSDMRESVGIPVRQIMKCLEKEPETFSEEDMAILKRIYADRIEQGKSLDDMAGSDDYGSLVADYIKPPTLKDDRDMKDFLKVWVDVGLKNPGIYFDEALRWSTAYWWPGYDPVLVYYPTPAISVKQFSDEYDLKNRRLKDYFYPLAMSLEKQPESLDRTMEEELEGNRLFEHFFDVDYNFPGAVKRMLSLFDAIEKIPVLSLPFVPAAYSWLLLIGLAYCFSRRRKYEIGLWPLLLIIALACLSPVNGYMRYLLPVCLFSFIMLGICLLPQRTAADDRARSSTGKEQGNDENVRGNA